MQEFFQVLTIFVPVLSAALFIKCAYFCFRDGFKWRWSDLLVTGSALAVLGYLWQTHLGLALGISIALNSFLLLRSVVGSTVYYLLINGDCAVFVIWATLLAKLHFDARRGFLFEQAKAAKLISQGDRNTAIALLERRQSELPFLEWYAKELLLLAGARSAADDKEIIARAKMLSEVKMDSRFKFGPLLILALAQMKACEPEEALASLGKIDSFVPRAYKNVFEVGLRSALGCTESTEALLRQNKAPEFMAAYFRGLSDFARGNADQARSNWKRAIELIDADPRSKAFAPWKDTCEKRLKMTNREAVCIYTVEREKRLDQLLQSISTPRRKSVFRIGMQPTSNVQSGNLTPVDHQQCAGFFRRFAATTFDCAIVFLVGASLLYVVPLVLSSIAGVDSHGGNLDSTKDVILSAVFIVSGILIFAGSLMYGPIFESSRLQATPGKYLLNLNAVRIDGNRMQFNEAMNKQWNQHILAAVLGICFPIYAASYLFLLGKHKQTIYDKVCNRVVVVKGPPRLAFILPIIAVLVLVTGAGAFGIVNLYRQHLPGQYVQSSTVNQSNAKAVNSQP